MDRTIKWGVIAPGNISNSFAEGMKEVLNSEICAVASRDLNRAEAFAKKFGIEKTYGSYEAIMRDEEVDAVYIATPNPYHKEISIMGLNHKKAVLCEKPAVLNLKELGEVIRTAEENKTFYMEAMWTKFLPVMKEVKRIISEGRIGEIRMVKADFCFRAPFDAESRLYKRELGGGALLDVGVYTIAFACDMLGKDPSYIKGFGDIGRSGVDEQDSAILGYEDGKFAALSFAISTETEHNAYVYGTEGYIKLPQFWRAREAVLVRNGEEQVIRPDFKGNGYNYEVEEVNRCLRAGKVQSDRMSWNHSREVISIMDELRRQWKLVYPGEE
ncbi:MAG: Gfo/Idh/MocA family oxidoreductase [Bacillota bacterium]|nr:Gfo/Idh/MocA family oxidoreductase [Bacillota bacterium]